MRNSKGDTDHIQHLEDAKQHMARLEHAEKLEETLVQEMSLNRIANALERIADTLDPNGNYGGSSTFIDKLMETLDEEQPQNTNTKSSKELVAEITERIKNRSRMPYDADVDE